MNNKYCVNIGIITLPLYCNYGGVLQNFALQETLKKIGYRSITFNKVVKRPLWKVVGSLLKTFYYKVIKRHSWQFLGFSPNRLDFVSDFLQKYIELSPSLSEYNHCVVNEYINQFNFFALIVGSDQVWRPKYNKQIEEMFLKFAKKIPIKRVAYAASFGVDDWEYSSKQTRECSKLAKKFDAISVREDSGVNLCKEHLGVDATWVLDPTLLLTKDDYLPICENVPICHERYLAVYVLDENEKVMTIYEKEANERGLNIRKFHAGSKSTLTIPEWLAMFRDASYVVTDSFHGTVFSIIFGKEFKCIYNKDRGAARFESLMNLYNSGKLEEMREFSLNWLKNALEK